jgi:hypothetical protein
MRSQDRAARWLAKAENRQRERRITVTSSSSYAARRTQKRMAEAFGVSLRTIQRDRAVALHKAFAEEVPKAEAEDRAIDFNRINTDAASHFADTLCRRETAVLDRLDCLIRPTEMKGDMAAEIEPPGDNDLK